MAVQATSIPISELASNQRDEMFAVMTRCFDGVQRHIFEADLAEKSQAFVLVDDAHGRVCGFSTLSVLSADVQGTPVRAFFSGDTVIDRQYWSSLALEQCWIAYTTRRVADSPRFRWFWFLICNSYRSFRYLPVYARTYYPNPETSMPPFERAVLDTLARLKFGESYDAERGTIRLPDGCRLRPGVGDISERELRDPRVAFFQRMNPDWRDGVELACLSEFSPDNYQPTFLRFMEQAVRRRAACTGE